MSAKIKENIANGVAGNYFGRYFDFLCCALI